VRRLVSTESPASKGVDRAPLDRLGVLLFHNVLLPITPSWRLITWFEKPCEAEALQQTQPTDAAKQLIKTYTSRTRIIGTLWVVVVTGGLIYMWMANPADATIRDVFSGLAAWRWLEIVTVGLGIALKQEESVLGNSLLTIGVWAVQLALIFAVLDHTFATNAFVLYPHTRAAVAATHPLEYLYIAWTYMVTLGSSFEPTTGGARVLSMATSTSGVMLLAVFVASAVARRDAVT
jgi:hypothetical protein